MKATDGSGLRIRQAGFARVSNATIRDRTLSLRARGLLTLVLSLPPGWDLRTDWLIEQSDEEGREAIMNAIRELRRRGHYRVERRRRPDGTFCSGVSVSDERVLEWAAEHAAACLAQRTAKPRWDVTVRLRPDGSLDDEPDDPTLPEPPLTDGEDPVADDRKRLTGDRSTRDGSTGERSTDDRLARHQKEDVEEDRPLEQVGNSPTPAAGAAGALSSAGDGRPADAEPPSSPSSAAAGCDLSEEPPAGPGRAAWLEACADLRARPRPVEDRRPVVPAAARLTDQPV